jgi:hypothetical protein
MSTDTSAVDEKNRHIVKWLSNLDFEVKQIDLFEKREEGTGEWLLEESSFKEWLKGTYRTLWCAGDRTFHNALNGVFIVKYTNSMIAGVGKSILA